MSRTDFRFCSRKVLAESRRSSSSMWVPTALPRKGQPGCRSPKLYSQAGISALSHRSLHRPAVVEQSMRRRWMGLEPKVNWFIQRQHRMSLASRSPWSLWMMAPWVVCRSTPIAVRCAWTLTPCSPCPTALDSLLSRPIWLATAPAWTLWCRYQRPSSILARCLQALTLVWALWALRMRYRTTVTRLKIRLLKPTTRMMIRMMPVSSQRHLTTVSLLRSWPIRMQSKMQALALLCRMTPSLKATTLMRSLGLILSIRSRMTTSPPWVSRSTANQAGSPTTTPRNSQVLPRLEPPLKCWPEMWCWDRR